MLREENMPESVGPKSSVAHESMSIQCWRKKINKSSTVRTTWQKTPGEKTKLSPSKNNWLVWNCSNADETNRTRAGSKGAQWVARDTKIIIIIIQLLSPCKLCGFALMLCRIFFSFQLNIHPLFHKSDVWGFSSTEEKKTTALCNLPAATGPTPPLYVPYVTAPHDTETGSLIRPYRRGKNTTRHMRR